MKIIKNIEDYNYFSEILNDCAKVFKDRIFLIEGERQYSFDAFNKIVNKCCSMLADEGIKNGDIVSLILKNSIVYLILYFSVLKMGCVINPFPFHLGAVEIKDKLNFVKPKIIYSHSAHASGLDGSGLRIVYIQSDGESILEERLKSFSELDLAVANAAPEDTAFMYYSSGTTGAPKMIEYSARSEILTMASLLRSGFIENGDCHLCMLPLGHTAAIRYTILPSLLTGSKVVLFESFWKVRNDLWKAVEHNKVTFFETVPSILITILNTPYKDFNDCNISSLKFIGCGSAYLSSNLHEKFETKFNIPVANMYGLSETGPTHFDNPFERGRKTGTVGRPLDIMDVRVFDDNGREVRTGELGEFAVKGPSLLKGYYKNKSQYESCFKNGYFLTGDIGYIEDNGIFHYVDRKKDLIIKGGVNIVPSQIDEILLSHESIKDVATIGKPDMFLGETIKSFIILKEGEMVDAKTLRNFCIERLGDFKTPSYFEFVDELPKGPSGKVLRRKLREIEYLKLKI